jgi:hypothetical protein
LFVEDEKQREKSQGPRLGCDRRAQGQSGERRSISRGGTQRTDRQHEGEDVVEVSEADGQHRPRRHQHHARQKNAELSMGWGDDRSDPGKAQETGHRHE